MLFSSFIVNNFSNMQWLYLFYAVCHVIKDTVFWEEATFVWYKKVDNSKLHMSGVA